MPEPVAGCYDSLTSETPQYTLWGSSPGLEVRDRHPSLKVSDSVNEKCGCSSWCTTEEGLGDTVMRTGVAKKLYRHRGRYTLKLMATFTMRLSGVEQRAAGDQGTQQSCHEIGKIPVVSPQRPYKAQEKGSSSPTQWKKPSSPTLNLSQTVIK